VLLPLQHFQFHQQLLYQIESDLLFAVQNAPDYNPADKRVMTKTVARALLAKLYAEKPLRDYEKVIKYADDVAKDGPQLVDDFSVLFGMKKDEKGNYIDAKVCNTSESLLEAQFVAGDNNWCYMMFGRNLLNWDENFSWNKWVTPSRDLIKLYESEGDVERFQESIVIMNVDGLFIILKIITLSCTNVVRRKVVLFGCVMLIFFCLRLKD
jgi:hypothetical protein